MNMSDREKLIDIPNLEDVPRSAIESLASGEAIGGVVTGAAVGVVTGDVTGGAVSGGLVGAAMDATGLDDVVEDFIDDSGIGLIGNIKCQKLETISSQSSFISSRLMDIRHTLLLH